MHCFAPVPMAHVEDPTLEAMNGLLVASVVDRGGVWVAVCVCVCVCVCKGVK